MATEGPNYPTANTDNAGVGTLTWTNPTNIGAADAAYATASWGPVVGTVIDTVVQLWDAGAVIGTPQPTSIWSNGVDRLDTFGSSSNLWGATLTPTIVNGTGFGVALSCSAGGTQTHYLLARRFGFAIPSTATIVGVVMETLRSQTGGIALGARVDYMRMTIHYTMPSTNSGGFFLLMGGQ